MRYIIKGLLEETQCAQCGCPLYNGDKAYYHAQDDGESFCSKHCGARFRDPPKRDVRVIWDDEVRDARGKPVE